MKSEENIPEDEMHMQSVVSQSRKVIYDIFA